MGPGPDEGAGAALTIKKSRISPDIKKSRIGFDIYKSPISPGIKSRIGFDIVKSSKRLFSNIMSRIQQEEQ